MADSKSIDPPDPFTEYYARESLSEATLGRFAATKEAIFRVLQQRGLPRERLTVADIGCGAGTQAIMWARAGHDVHGADINAQLIDLGRRRAQEAGVRLQFEVASAVQLPWPLGTMDVCLLPELLEHVVDWRSCLAEAARLLKPSGLLYLSTTNRLCPLQQEFDLPLYSWYPPPLKRHFERLAVTTRPELVNHAKFPAVHWFDFYSLRRTHELRDFTCFDRFDVAALAPRTGFSRAILRLVTRSRALRLAAHIATPYTMLFAIRTGAAPSSHPAAQ